MVGARFHLENLVYCGVVARIPDADCGDYSAGLLLRKMRLIDESKLHDLRII